MRAFLVTFQRFTPESLEHGEAEESDVLYESASLREAVEELRYASAGIHASEEPAVSPAWGSPSRPAPIAARTGRATPTWRWITGACTRDDPRTGEFWDLTLHFPDHITPASRRRVLRLLKR